MNHILLLGASSDISKAIAEQVAPRGVEISLAGRNIHELKPFQQDLEIRFKAKVNLLEFDARNTQTHSSFAQGLPDNIDYALVVFGYLGDQELAENNWEEAHKIIETNYTGAVSICGHLANQFDIKGYGNIIGISSVAGDRGRASNYYYGSAKAGFSTFLSGLRNRLAKKGVHVMTVKPGFMYTKMTEHLNLPAPLTSSPEQAAKTILKAAIKKKNVIYVSFIWRYLMLIIKNIPEPVFKKLKL
jgi:decaprenylphospho-beta-D-erythro-pentofuranosid-2-ulose 2-reductase